jgi:hypothetical protein
LSLLARTALAIESALLAVLLLLPALAQTDRPTDNGPVRIQIKAEPIDAFQPGERGRVRFGPLEFRGGLQLTSPYKAFGGLSALRLFADGANFISLSDKGRWLKGRIAYANGRPIGIDDAEMAPILGPDGRPLAARGWYDTESIAIDGDTLYVGIERVNRIVRLDYGRSGLLARGQSIAVPAGIGSLPNNRGLECLEFIPRSMPGGGTLVAISERGLDSAGNIRGFLIGGKTPGEFSVARHNDFDISDCAVLPDRNLILLERRFSWSTGIAMRLRRIPLQTLAPGAVVDGEEILTADMGYQIDNMEGLSVHRSSAGEVLLTMVSDDNFSLLQRTILLQFALIGE